MANTTWNIYNFRLNVIRHLLARGFRVTVLAPIDEYVRYTDKFREVEHINLQHLQRDGTNPYEDFKLMRELLSHYRRLRPDVILHYTVKPNIYGGLVSKYLGIRSVAVVTGLGYPFIHGGFASVFTRGLYRISNRYHKKVIFENEDDLELFVEQRLIARSQGVSIKGCGVDTEYFSPGPELNKGTTTTFTFIGRLLYDKGIREFVEAAHMVKKKHSDVRFWLIGQIDEGNPSAIKKADLVHWIKDPNIDYLGSKQDVRPYILETDCVVLPSYREAIARSLTEAMSMAKPVIGTNTAGVREAIDEGENGFLVQVRDADSLARAMEAFINLDEEERRKMGEKGRQKALWEFDDNKIARQMCSIIEDIY